MLLRKGVYPNEYMDGWDFNVFKTFKLNNLGDYHDLYVQNDALLLADVLENFRKSCIKTYELDPAHFISLPGLD